MVVGVCVILAGSRAADSAGVVIRDAAGLVGVRCSVVTGRLAVGITGVVVRGAVETVCCCVAIDGNRTVDIAGAEVRGVAEAVEARVCVSASVSRAVGVPGVVVRSERLCAWRLTFFMGASGIRGNWVS